MNTAQVTVSKKLITAVLALQILTVVGLWTGQPRGTEAQAAIPDPGAQREAQVAEQKKTNENLEKLMELLKSGEVKIRVERK